MAALTVGSFALDAQQNTITTPSTLAGTPAPDAAAPAASPELAQFQQLEDKWAAAIASKDQYTLELLLAPSYVGISSMGGVADRNEEIAHLFSKDAAGHTVDLKAVSVRVSGEFAVVNGTYIQHPKDKWDGVEEKGIFTQVFERGKNGWLCINAQRTIVVNQALQKGKSQQKK